MTFKTTLGEDKSALIAKAKRPGEDKGPAKGQAAADPKTSAASAETSPMPPPAAKSGALTGTTMTSVVC